MQASEFPESAPVEPVRTATDIFISYSREDRRFYDALLQELKPIATAAGLTIFSDSHDIASGEQFSDVIRKALATTRIFVFMVSPASVNSDYIRNEELAVARERWKEGTIRVVPVMVSDAGRLLRRGSWLTQIQFAGEGRALDDLAPNQLSAQLKIIARQIIEAAPAPSDRPAESSPSAPEARLRAPGPKRLLAIDGAGGRTLIALAYLGQLERTLRTETGNPVLRLSEYFDIIGGSGFGAVLAARLSTGLEVSEIIPPFQRFLRTALTTRSIFSRFSSKYSSEDAGKALHSMFRDGPRNDYRTFQTVCCVFAYCINTAKPVTFHNLRLSPADLVESLRACIATPTLFEPATFYFEGEKPNVYADSSMAMTGGAAVPLFEAATSSPFSLATGSDRLLLVSIGSGLAPFRDTQDNAQGRNIIGWAGSLPTLLALDAERQNELFLRGIAHTPFPMVVDEETHPIDGLLLPGAPALTYLRYDADLTALATYGLEEMVTDVDRLSSYDDRDAWEDWLRIGDAAARQQIQPAHFSPSFHPPVSPEHPLTV